MAVARGLWQWRWLVTVAVARRCGAWQWLADKRTAYIVHANWVKKQKKSRMARDGLWFLQQDDGRCDADFDPLDYGCSKLCIAVGYTAPGVSRLGARPCAAA